MDQPDFAPLHEASYQRILLEQQASTSDGAGYAAATKSNCTDCDYAMMKQPDFSPLFVPSSSSLEAAAGKAPFAGLVERAKYLW